MGTTLIERLFAQFDAVTGKFMRVIGGRRSDGTAQAFLTNPEGSMFIEGSQELSGPFNNLRVSEPFGIFDAKQIFDNNPQFYGTLLVGGGTAPYQLNQSATLMSVTAAAGDSVVRQSLEYMPYQAGRAQFISMTAVMGAKKANVRQRIGYFDTQNGAFFQQDGTNLSVVIRSFVTGAVVDTVINQGSWNIDTLDGAGPPTNPSGVTIDMTKNQLFVIDFLWLSAGRVRFGFVIEGKIIYCHEHLTANVLSQPWCTTPLLPVRWELTNTAATAGATTMLQICASVFSEGGFNPLGLVAAACSPLTPTFAFRALLATTPTPIMSIRLKAAYNRAVIVPRAFEALANGADNYIAEVFVGGTLSGGAAVTTSVSDAAEMITGTNLLTGGRRIAIAFGSNQARLAGTLIESARVVASDVAGTADLLTVVITTFTASGFWTSLTWKELY